MKGWIGLAGGLRATVEYKPCTVFLSLDTTPRLLGELPTSDLMLFRARPISPAERHPPNRKPRVAGVRMEMNETVYLFALSVPALLEALVADQNPPLKDTRAQEPEKRPS
jgi:hypothetical protein